ncbi:unnamed protein product, partial [Rotaria sp. Silwood1]
MSGISNVVDHDEFFE